MNTSKAQGKSCPRKPPADPLARQPETGPRLSAGDVDHLRGDGWAGVTGSAGTWSTTPRCGSARRKTAGTVRRGSGNAIADTRAGPWPG